MVLQKAIKTRLKKQTKNKPKTNQANNQKQTNNISNFLFLISNFNFNNNVYNLLVEYLELRIKNKYTLTETVVKRLINKLDEYGTNDEEKVEIITNAINGAWKDFYPLKKHETKPNWYGVELEEERASDEEIQKIERALRGI